ncbi:unnamed protein product [Paramecium sonneborni]|uniref:Uncharacterized protein n=1 Tax=Paramecium sonneborni TaxID=65129 RepID=A0A8S1RRT3_9CILI|nr:unnamed protein product [Paramecium sonneborni]
MLVKNFVDKNLSPFNNDLRQLLPLLQEQKYHVEVLDYQNECQIKGLQQLQKKDHDFAFILEWTQSIFNQEYFVQYMNQILVFFNQKIVLNQEKIQDQQNQIKIQDQLIYCLKQLLNLSTKGLDFRCKIELESIMKMVKIFYYIYNNWYNLLNVNIFNIINTPRHIIFHIYFMTKLFDVGRIGNSIIIKFEQSDIQSISPQNHYLDDYFYFCRLSI